MSHFRLHMLFVTIFTVLTAITLLSCDQLPFGENPENKKLTEAITTKITEGGLGALQVKVEADAKTGVVQLEALLGNARQEKQLLDIVKAVPGVKEVIPKFTFTDPNADNGMIQDGTTGLGGGMF